MKELHPREWRTETWIVLGGLVLVVVCCLIAYLSLTNQITGARDDLTSASYNVSRAERGIVEHDTILQGMGEELKGLSTNLEQIEADCHIVARKHTPKPDVASQFQHYSYCMAHHGWQPVGWKG